MELSIVPKNRAKKERAVILPENGNTVITLANEEITPLMHIVPDEEPTNTVVITEDAAAAFAEDFGRQQGVVASTASVSAVSTAKPFIEANTVEATIEELRDNHIIPVFIKDNEPVISHVDFIETTLEAVNKFYAGESILMPNIRLSHPIKGRVPEAKNKPASQLLEHEKTLYYERMAFVIEIPSVATVIDGSRLSLCIGGVKAYNVDNLYNKKGADEHFKIFIGFQNLVCTNLCISTDGYKGDIRVTSAGELLSSLNVLLDSFNAPYTLQALRSFADYSLTDEQFARLIGRCRMYGHLPKQVQGNIPQLSFGDTQVGLVVKDYYSNKSFCKNANGTINLWKLYNLFTGANKSSYIDSFLQRGVNAFQFIYALKTALDGQENNWFLS